MGTAAEQSRRVTDGHPMIIIDAPHFHAAVVIDDRTLRVVRAAPILRYMIGWDRQRVIAYAAKHGWGFEARY